MIFLIKNLKNFNKIENKNINYFVLLITIIFFFLIF